MAQKSLLWFKEHLTHDILPHWLRSAVTDTGLFVPNLDRTWSRVGDEIGTLVSQSRLLYTFSKGYELTGEEKYLEAVERGARFLLDHFRDPLYGGWLWSCNSQGQITDTQKNSYGHAFAIFGLSHAYQITGDDALKEAALDIWRILKSKFRDDYGGFAFTMARDFRSLDAFKSQNPIMHLCEALLALSDVEGLGAIREEAEEVAAFVFTHLFRTDDGCLPEVYTVDWKELPEAQTGRIDVGHAFEWAYLLSHGVEKGLPARYLSIGERLLDYGLKVGYDMEQGSIYSPATPDGRITSKRKGWWEQCELIRTLMHFAIVRDRTDLWRLFQQSVGFVQRDFIDPEYGGWYTFREPGIDPTAQDKGSVWKVDYHVVGMGMEAVRLESIARR